MKKTMSGPTALISTAQNFTTSWADLGSEINTLGAQSIALWLELDINAGANLRVKPLAKLTPAATNEYALPIKTAGASALSIEGEYNEFNVDADQKLIMRWDLDRCIPLVQFQVQAGTAGTTAAQVDSASFTLGY